MSVTIRDVRAICTRPSGFNLVIVRIDTSEPELYGLGCATFTFRHEPVKSVVERYFKPLLVGRDVSRIEDIWQMLNVNAYWRCGPVLNNALGGVDMALWDIKGKMANMPLYDLLGGMTRAAVPVYRYAEDNDLDVLVEQVQRLMEENTRYIRLSLRNAQRRDARRNAPVNAADGFYYDTQLYCKDTVEMFDYVRGKVGEEIELCHDVHERLQPSQAFWLAKNLEPYRPYFIEDPLGPENIEWFRTLRSQSTAPIAFGELAINSREWESVIKDRLIDIMRPHVSQIGGITPARKLAAFCELFGVRMAWHSSPDCSPVGHMANVQMGMAFHNVVIQEWPELNERLYEIFPGAPYVKDGYAYANNKPGLGIGFDEKMAEKYPAEIYVTPWIEMRQPDGSIQRP